MSRESLRKFFSSLSAVKNHKAPRSSRLGKGVFAQLEPRVMLSATMLDVQAESRLNGPADGLSGNLTEVATRENVTLTGENPSTFTQLDSQTGLLPYLPPDDFSQQDGGAVSPNLIVVPQDTMGHKIRMRDFNIDERYTRSLTDVVITELPTQGALQEFRDGRWVNLEEGAIVSFKAFKGNVRYVPNENAVGLDRIEFKIKYRGEVISNHSPEAVYSFELLVGTGGLEPQWVTVPLEEPSVTPTDLLTGATTLTTSEPSPETSANVTEVSPPESVLERVNAPMPILIATDSSSTAVSPEDIYVSKDKPKLILKKDLNLTQGYKGWETFVVITQLPQNGQLQRRVGNAWEPIAIGSSVKFNQFQRKVRYVPSNGYTGTDAIAFKVDYRGANGGALGYNADLQYTMNLFVGNNPTVGSVTWDLGVGEQKSLLGLVDGFVDSDGDALKSVTLTVLPMNGAIYRQTANGSEKVNLGTDGLLEIAAAELEQYSFVPNDDYVGEDSFRFYVTDTSGMASVVRTANINVQNKAPNSTTLTRSEIDENAGADAIIGTFETTDIDNGDTFTYTLVAGVEDNAYFSIDGTNLIANTSFNYEEKNRYSIVVRTTDSKGASIDSSFDISVTNVNEAPNQIALTSTNLQENAPIGTVVGSLTTTDEDAGDTFTYSLVSGEGSDDNDAFRISGNQLITDRTFDYESQDTLLIRVRSTDKTGLTFERALIVTVGNVNEPPTVRTESQTHYVVSSGERLELDLQDHFIDADGDTLTYDITSEVNAVLMGSNLTIEDVGEIGFDVTVTAYDGSNESTVSLIHVTVMNSGDQSVSFKDLFIDDKGNRIGSVGNFEKKITMLVPNSASPPTLTLEVYSSFEGQEDENFEGDSESISITAAAGEQTSVEAGGMTVATVSITANSEVSVDGYQAIDVWIKSDAGGLSQLMMGNHGSAESIEFRVESSSPLYLHSSEKLDVTDVKDLTGNDLIGFSASLQSIAFLDAPETTYADWEAFQTDFMATLVNLNNTLLGLTDKLNGGDLFKLVREATEDKVKNLLAAVTQFSDKASRNLEAWSEAYVRNLEKFGFGQIPKPAWGPEDWFSLLLISGNLVGNAASAWAAISKYGKLETNKKTKEEFADLAGKLDRTFINSLLYIPINGGNGFEIYNPNTEENKTFGITKFNLLISDLLIAIQERTNSQSVNDKLTEAQNSSISYSNSLERFTNTKVFGDHMTMVFNNVVALDPELLRAVGLNPQLSPQSGVKHKTDFGNILHDNNTVRIGAKSYWRIYEDWSNGEVDPTKVSLFSGTSTNPPYYLVRQNVHQVFDSRSEDGDQNVSIAELMEWIWRHSEWDDSEGNEYLSSVDQEVFNYFNKNGFGYKNLRTKDSTDENEVFVFAKDWKSKQASVSITFKSFWKSF